MQRWRINRVHCLISDDGTLVRAEERLCVVPFTYDDIHEALQAMASTKTSSPDGLPVLFYQKYWHIIEAMMLRMGFATPWINLIMHCVNSVSYSVLLNGDMGPSFVPAKGL
ncbi:hypothetical protein PVK06_034357 [Gossypium arboreum]|uniref:Reverse transcriptase n=1 Tax=Gossypium arboreum TaxID=29729 RepID=A0ABR0NG28_GOSAR|nr:hypothetical protein PVK06_034357 [Gossypium arboreum]